MWKKSGIFKSVQFKIINIIAACIFICCMMGVAGGDKTIGTLEDFVVEMTGGEINETEAFTIHMQHAAILHQSKLRLSRTSGRSGLREGRLCS